MLVKFSEHCVLGDKENYHNLLCIVTAKGNLLENGQELLCCLLPFGERTGKCGNYSTAKLTQGRISGEPIRFVVEKEVFL